MGLRTIVSASALLLLVPALVPLAGAEDVPVLSAAELAGGVPVDAVVLDATPPPQAAPDAPPPVSWALDHVAAHDTAFATVLPADASSPTLAIALRDAPAFAFRADVTGGALLRFFVDGAIVAMFDQDSERDFDLALSPGTHQLAWVVDTTGEAGGAIVSLVGIADIRAPRLWTPLEFTVNACPGDTLALWLSDALPLVGRLSLDTDGIALPVDIQTTPQPGETLSIARFSAPDAAQLDVHAVVSGVLGAVYDLGVIRIHIVHEPYVFVDSLARDGWPFDDATYDLRPSIFTGGMLCGGIDRADLILDGKTVSTTFGRFPTYTFDHDLRYLEAHRFDLRVLRADGTRFESSFLLEEGFDVLELKLFPMTRVDVASVGAGTAFGDALLPFQLPRVLAAGVSTGFVGTLAFPQGGTVRAVYAPRFVDCAQSATCSTPDAATSAVGTWLPRATLTVSRPGYEELVLPALGQAAAVSHAHATPLPVALPGDLPPGGASALAEPDEPAVPSPHPSTSATGRIV